MGIAKKYPNQRRAAIMANCFTGPIACIQGSEAYETLKAKQFFMKFTNTPMSPVRDGMLLAEYVRRTLAEPVNPKARRHHPTQTKTQESGCFSPYPRIKHPEGLTSAPRAMTGNLLLGSGSLVRPCVDRMNKRSAMYPPTGRPTRRPIRDEILSRPIEREFHNNGGDA
jgi:hypothetical protein